MRVSKVGLWVKPEHYITIWDKPMDIPYVLGFKLKNKWEIVRLLVTVLAGFSVHRVLVWNKISLQTGMKDNWGTDE